MNFPFHGFIVYWNSTSLSLSPLSDIHIVESYPTGLTGYHPNPCFDLRILSPLCNLHASSSLFYYTREKKRQSKNIFPSRSTRYLDKLLLASNVKRVGKRWNGGRERSISRKICGNVKFLGFPRLCSKSREMVYWKKKEGREKKKFFFPSLPSLMKIIAIRSDLMSELV